MQDERDTGQEGCRKTGMQEKRNEKERRDEGIKERSDEEKEGFRSD